MFENLVFLSKLQDVILQFLQSLPLPEYIFDLHCVATYYNIKYNYNTFTATKCHDNIDIHASIPFSVLIPY